MKLQGRELSEGLEGNDVQRLHQELALLGYEIRRSELQEKIFGADTKEAVNDFQRKRGFEPTGVVDPQTARLINSAVDALPPRKYLVKGKVKFQDGSALDGLTVRAFDKDLRGEERLGETATDEHGAYKISYTSDKFARAEKRGPDLIVRAFSPEVHLLAESEPVFNAPQEVTIDLNVVPREQPEEPSLSEYEQLITDLASVLQDISLASLTKDDIEFLVKETGNEKGRILFLSQADALAIETGLPTEAFYGWARMDLPLNLDKLRAIEAEALINVLKRAIDENIIPQALGPLLEKIVKQLKEPGEVQPPVELVTYEFVGQLINEQTDEPLVGFTVHATYLDEGEESQALGYDITDSRGLFAFTYSAPRATDDDEEVQVKLRLRLRILDRQAQEIADPVIEVRSDDKEPRRVKVAVPAAPEPSSPEIEEVAEATELELPEGLINALTEHDVRTLADIRKLGGLRHLEGLPVEQDHPAVQKLDAHASLSILSSDYRVNAQLIEKDFTSVASIAGTPRHYFVRELHGDVGDFAAARIHAESSAQHSLLNNTAAHIRADLANGFQPAIAGGLIPKFVPKRCGCEDCEAAVSPLAYLADLLDYAVRHVQQNGQNIDLGFLKTTFHQPFGDLPATCRAAEDQIRQVRLCVEILRSFLGHRPLAEPNREAALVKEEDSYTWFAYTTLLTRLGTSYEELMLAQVSPEERDRLSERLGVGPNRVAALYLDRANATESRLQEVFGLVDSTREDPLAAQPTPSYETWQNEHLHKLWFDEDWPGEWPADGLPFIDPDVIGPDDFWSPVKKPNQPDPDQAFDIWLKRREWIDARIGELNNIARKQVHNVSVPDLEEMFHALSKQIQYGNFQSRPWTIREHEGFQEIAVKLNGGNEEDVKKTISDITNNLYLTVDSFNRLMQIWEKEQRWEANAVNESLTEDEWRELISILVQVRKVELFPVWWQEEIDWQADPNNAALGPEQFWVSAREPAEGDWPPIKDHPFIDPEQVDSNALPEWEVGAKAYELWQQRRDELDQVFRELKAAREQNGFQAMVARALAEPPGDINAIPHDLDLLYHQLNDPDPQVVNDAEKAIRDDLYMSLEDFSRLMTVHQKQYAAETAPNVQNRPRPPSEEEWHEVYAILTTSEKRFRKYAQGQWSQEETDAGLLYWTALKARLPRWRASANARSTWQETLRIRSKAALINPDVIGPGDIVNPRQGDAAYDIWADRDSELSTRQGGLKQIRELVGNELAGLDDICQSVFGENKTSAFLAKLNDERNEGNDIAPRLAQLNLEQNEFATLLRLRSSIKAGGPLPEAQWQDVYALLVTVAKRRMTAQWRREEKDAQISLTPNMFVVSEDTPEIFIHLEPGSRKDRRARHKWQEVLQTRIDQAQAVSEALAEAVSATEETALPLLRNALIMACDAPGNELGEKAKWLMDRLLVDTQASGCQQTTRIAQAIETIQGLLWSIRTGQLEDTYPGLQLPADNFDEEWEWIGSYATWRAAMFVFLYPENILIPSLRKRQSRGFRNLVSGLRNNNRLTPEMACRAATSYSEHFRDICHLTVEATCHASTRAYLGACRDKRDAGYRNLFYMFGRGQETNTVYWSAYDPDDESGYAQSFWEPIEGMKDVIKLIGAVPYEIDSSERFIFLFAIVQEDESQKLAFVKYNLEQPGEWSSEPILLEELPEEATVFTAVVKQHQRANNPPHLAVRVPSGAIYDRKLNPQGSDWEDEPEHELVSAKKGSEISALHAMVETGENEFSLFVSDYSGRLRYSVKRQELLGLKSGPAACFVHSHSKRMDVFVRGQDDDLWQTWWHEGQTWQEWKSLGGHLTSDPAVVSDAYFSFHIFALGANNVLLHKYSVNKSWSNWNSLGGEWCSRPAVTSWGHDRIDVFVRGLDDNALYHKWFDGSVWSQELVRGGGPHGGVVNSAPAAISLGNGLIDVFVLGDDDRLWHISYDEHNGGWSQNWEMIEGGPWTSPPTVTSLYSVMDIFIRGEDAALWHIGANRWTGSWQWQNPESWGGILASPPAAIAIRKPHGRQPDEYFIHVFARGTDNFIWHGQWSMTGHRLVSATEWTGFIETVGEEVGENKELIWHTFGIGTWLGAFQWAQSDEVYAFWRNRGHQTFYTTISNHQKRLPLSSGQGWIESMAVHAGGSASGDRTRIAYEKYASWVPYRYRCVFEQLNATLVESDTLPIAPRVFPDVPDPFVITESMTAEQLQQRRHQLESIFYEADNSFWPDTIRAYIEEAYYFVPVFLALQLQRRRHFVAALDWFRNVYDYSRQVDEPKIYYGLKQEDNFSTSFNRVAEWLLDPLNPHAIASTRANTYTHFTLLSLVRCFLDYADDEFTRDTAESVPRARTLYHTALELLSLPVLNQRLLPCQDVIGAIDIQIGEAIRTNAPQWLPVWERVKEIRSRINNMNAQRMASEELRNILGTDASWDERLANAQAYVDEMADVYSKDEAMSSVLSENGEMAAGMHGALFAHDDIYETTRSLAEVVGRDFSKAVSFVSGIDEETLAKEPKVELPWLRNPAISDAEGHGRSAVMLRSRLQGGGATNMSLVAGRNRWSDLTVAKKWPTSYVPAPIFHFCIPPNPVLMGLRLHAELNLFKLRTCRNISGMERQLDPYAAPTDTVSGLPTIGPGGQLTLPGTVVYRMTPYRYTTLIERAKQLVQFATQIESAMLSALEKREAEYYNLLIARQDVKFTRAGIRLQDLRVREAEGGVVLAELQRDQAQIRIGHYEKLLREGLSGLEGTAIGFMVTSAALQTVAAGFHTAAAASYLSPLSLSSHFTSTAAVFSSLAGASSTIASIISTYASYERRAQEWEFRKTLAEQNILIGNQQVTIATDHVRVVGQERRIAMIKNDHAKETMDFLANKFTNIELYDWMSSILEGVYSYFLQQATAMAEVAEHQMAFDRQETPPGFIQADYWEAPSETALSGNVEGSSPDRRGLTGSARLLRDIYQLDQYAFETDKRKSQLTKTISLARQSPVEFQRFRETGVMPFETPMELFDRDYPGLYLRLIKRVRTSVIALVPPTQGIHAMLSTTGMSRVVIGKDVFQKVVLRRHPETVALSAPREATGLFELQPQLQAEMLLPFEGLGVDTSWELRMPKASNQFDYSTIADVLVTIEYTALDSYDYRRQVIEELDSQFTADRPFSFRHQFADAWFDLHNPDQTASPMTVRFKIHEHDFPPNIDNLKINNVVLYFARASGQTFEIEVDGLHFAKAGPGALVGGRSRSVDGVISTRRANGATWRPMMIGKSPVGEWELALPPTTAMRDRFKNEEIDDILLVITYAGETPPWPA